MHLAGFLRASLSEFGSDEDVLAAVGADLRSEASLSKRLSFLLTEQQVVEITCFFSLVKHCQYLAE